MNYYGICENTKISGVKIIRPLLHFTKSVLIKICDENNVPYSIDKSNFDTSIARNKIRSEVINNLSLKERLKILEEINNKNKELKKLIASLNCSNLNSVSYILSLDSRRQKYALNIAVKKLDNSISLSKENVGEIIKVFQSNKPNVLTLIKRGLYLMKEYDCYHFSRSAIEIVNYSFVLTKPGKLDTHYFYLNFENGGEDRNVFTNDYPITIRNIKQTDKYKINDYVCSVSRLLIDWKVPTSIRQMWPVILNKNGEIIYIPRYQKDFNKIETNFFVKTNRK